MRTVDFTKEEFSEKEKRNIEILDILRRRGPISRPQISQEMGINLVTVSNYIDDFIEHKLVYERELDVSEGGRRPALLDLDTKGGYIIGAGLNLTNMVGLLLDLKGNIVVKTQAEQPDLSVTGIAERLLDIIRQVIRRSKDYTSNIKGIGVGIAGIVNKKEGSIRWPEKEPNATNYVSVNVPLKDLLEREFGLPVLVENDATCACFGEYWLQLEPSLQNILFMFSGVGCGIIINGEIYTGALGCAGEPSIHNYKEDQLFNCSLGNPCFLKRWDTDLGIVQDFIAKTGLGSSNKVDLKSVFMAAKAKDEAARAVLNTAAKRLGIKIAYLVDLFNPQVVVIGGGLEEAGEEFLQKVTLAVKEWAFREATEDLKVIYSQLRENAVALGAASLVMRKAFAQLY
ncbi:MAG: ROK family protein [Candidatus Omnitrophota bacterium]|jgi:predicted NBD/HSP70 family sugar kinase